MYGSEVYVKILNFTHSRKNIKTIFKVICWSTWLAQSGEHTTLDLRVEFEPTLGVEIT